MFLFPGTGFYGLILLLLVRFLRSLLLFLPSNCKGGTHLSWRRRVCSSAHLRLPLHMQHKLLLIGVWTGWKVYFGIKPYVGHNLLILWETTIANSDQPCFCLASAESWQCHQQCGRCNTPKCWPQQERRRLSQHWWGRVIAVDWWKSVCSFWPRNMRYGHRVILCISLGGGGGGGKKE